MVQVTVLCLMASDPSLQQGWLLTNGILLYTAEGKFADNTHYRQVSNIRRALVGNKFVDHSDVVGASPVGAAPTASSFST